MPPRTALMGTSMIVFPKVDPAKDASQKEKRTHICNVCSRAFKRSEHCIRHQRGHTQEKPFGCRVCRRRYSRRDLLVRHERTLHSAERLASATEQQVSKKAKGSSTHSAPDGSPNDGEFGVAPRHEHPPRREATPKQRSLANAIASKPVLKPSTPPPDDRHSQTQPNARSPRFLHPSSATTTRAAFETTTRPEARPSMMGLDAADLQVVMTDLEKMQTFPTSVPLPDLDGDLEFLDFFDPFLGLPPKQVEAFAFPSIDAITDGWSPLETFSSSSQTSLQDYSLQPMCEPLVTGDQIFDTLGLPSRRFDHRGSSSRDNLTGRSNGLDLHDTGPLSVLAESDRSSTPKLAQTPSAKPPALAFTEQMRATLLKDLATRLPGDQTRTFRLPSAVALQKCIQTYVNAFHVHLPIFHLHTLDFDRTPSPLVLAICAIGALYRLERKIAASLYMTADQALSAAVDRGDNLHKKARLLEDWSRPPSRQPKPYQDSLWTSQTRLLLAMFATFSGDPEVVSKAIVRLGDFLIDFRQLAPRVKPCKNGLAPMSWHEWVNRESIKRLIYGHVLYGNLVTMTYGIPPGYSIVSDGYIEMPCDQSLWDASTADQWHELAICKAKSSPLSLRDAVSRVMYGNCPKTVPEECWAWSPFAVSVVVNAVSIQLWHITQGSYFFGEFAGRGNGNGNGNGIWNSGETQKPQTLLQAEAALSRCRALITQARTDADYAWTEAEGPLLFNCLALLRVSYCRAFTGIGAADSMMLLKESHEELMASVEDFVAVPQDRSELITRAVSRAFEGMLIPYKIGHSLLQKTAALTWAVEHALAGWDAALLVTKWVHVLEIETGQNNEGESSDLEAQTMQTVRNLLAEVDDEAADQVNASLAAKLARYWAGFYDDTWVWGVTPRMGWVLRELANCYERNSLLV